MEAGGSRLPTVKPDHGTLVPGGSLHGLAYGAVTLCGGVFQPTSATVGGLPGLVAQPGTRNTTSPHARHVRVWFGLSPFRSPLLRGSRLVSLPPPTKMFSFGGFPSGAPDATSCSPVAGGPIRESRVRRLHAPRPGISPLAAPFLGARAEPSTRRRPCRSPGDGARPFVPGGTPFTRPRRHYVLRGQGSPGEKRLRPRAFSSGRLAPRGRGLSELTPPPYQARLLRGPSSRTAKPCGNGRLVSGWASRLDAFSGYPLRRGCPALPCRTTGRLEAAAPRSSRTKGTFPSGGRHPPWVESDLSHDGLTPAHAPL